MEDQYVIFWYYDSRAAGEQHWETYETLAEAQEALSSYAKAYPWNHYYLARITGEQPATGKEPKASYFSGITLTARGGVDSMAAVEQLSQIMNGRKDG